MNTLCPGLPSSQGRFIVNTRTLCVLAYPLRKEFLELILSLLILLLWVLIPLMKQNLSKGTQLHPTNTSYLPVISLCQANTLHYILQQYSKIQQKWDKDMDIYLVSSVLVILSDTHRCLTTVLSLSLITCGSNLINIPYSFFNQVCIKPFLNREVIGSPSKLKFNVFTWFLCTFLETSSKGINWKINGKPLQQCVMCIYSVFCNDAVFRTFWDDISNNQNILY